MDKLLLVTIKLYVILIHLFACQLLGSFAVSKTALLSLTKMIANEMLPVRINCVANGYIESNTSGRTVSGCTSA